MRNNKDGYKVEARETIANLPKNILMKHKIIFSDYV